MSDNIELHFHAENNDEEDMESMLNMRIRNQRNSVKTIETQAFDLSHCRNIIQVL